VHFGCDISDHRAIDPTLLLYYDQEIGM